MLEKIGETHSLSLNLKPKGHMATTPIIKVGGVCCDCDEATTKFCQSKNISAYPTYQIYHRGKFINVDSEVAGAGDSGIYKEILK